MFWHQCDLDPEPSVNGHSHPWCSSTTGNTNRTPAHGNVTAERPFEMTNKWRMTTAILLWCQQENSLARLYSLWQTNMNIHLHLFTNLIYNSRLYQNGNVWLAPLCLWWKVCCKVFFFCSCVFPYIVCLVFVYNMLSGWMCVLGACILPTNVLQPWHVDFFWLLWFVGFVYVYFDYITFGGLKGYSDEKWMSRKKTPPS